MYKLPLRRFSATQNGVVDISVRLLMLLTSKTDPDSFAKKSKLTSRQTSKYLHLLVDLHLLSAVNDSAEFKVTSQGKAFLREYQKLLKMFG